MVGRKGGSALIHSYLAFSSYCVQRTGEEARYLMQEIQ